MPSYSCYLALAAVLCVAPASSAQSKAAKSVRKSAAPAAAPVNPALAAMNLQFVRIAPGEFTMGSSTGMLPEQPPHLVRITKAFDLGKFEVTQAQWKTLMETTPGNFVGPDRPIHNVSWEDTQEFLKRLNAADPAHQYRLPTEAEWEYAARAGTTGDLPGELDEIAWHFLNSNSETHPVGQKKPNAWGLYDMYGNVWEWCQDWFDQSYYFSSPPADPPGPAQGSKKVLRGGSWGANATYTRSSVRIAFPSDQKNHYFGFRLVREARKD